MPAFLDQVTDLLTKVGPAGTGLAIAAVPVGITIAIYITKITSKVTVESLQAQLARETERHAEETQKLENKLRDLESRHNDLVKVGPFLHEFLKDIEAQIVEIAARIDAQDYSILVGAPSSIAGAAPSDLVFLCLGPVRKPELERVRVPIASSFAGQAFRERRSVIRAPEPRDGETFSRRTDKVADYRTKEVLSIPLLHRGIAVGVAQFLNKRGDRHFDADDATAAEQLAIYLSGSVARFIEDPRRLIQLGHAPRRNFADMSVLFADLSNFGHLFDELDSGVVTDMVNEALQRLCEIGLGAGGVIEQYMGDGFFLTFDASKLSGDHRLPAARAASMMKSAFAPIRDRWQTLGYPGSSDIFLRIGVSAGPVLKTEVGHAQHKRNTVIGPAVNVAAYLCEAGARTRDIVLVDEAIGKCAGSEFDLVSCEIAGHGFAAYELTRK